MRQSSPHKGDFISYFFGDQLGHEQQGRRPALVVSNDLFNQLTGVAFVCPVTNSDRGYPFHVPISPGGRVTGVVMLDQLKAIDYYERGFSFLERSPDGLLAEVLGVLDRIVN